MDSNSSQLKTENSILLDDQFFISKCSMISTGTERLVASGLVGKEFQEKMSVPHQAGSFELPIKYGYSLIVEGHDGNLGHVMHPHQNKVQVDSQEIFWADEDIPAHRFALISNIETVINAVWDSEPSEHEVVGICGFGNIGALLANTLRTQYNIEAVIVERDPWRRKKAESLGWKTYDNETFDIIYHATASESGLQFCIDHLNFEGKLVELSWYGNKKVNITLGKNFHYNRLRIISSQVSMIPGHMQGEHNYETRKKLAFQILKDDSFDSLITNIISFDSAPMFFDNLRKGEIEDGLIYVIEY